MSFENVVLSYPHPHVAVYVEDNTGYTESFLAADEPVTLIQCGAFAAGRDNELLYCETYDEFVNEFGAPNFKLYGQAGYNVAQALQTGYAAAHVLRVMPDDAAYSNLIVKVKYAVEEVTEQVAATTNPVVAAHTVTYKRLKLTYDNQSMSTGATSVQLFEDGVTALKSADPDADGAYNNPIFAIRQSGRGKYGNATRVRFADVTAYDDPDNNYKCYRLDVLEMGDSLTRKEYCFGSFNPDLYDADSSESLYLEDLVNDPEEGMAKVRINVYDDIVQDIVDMYNENCLTTTVTYTEGSATPVVTTDDAVTSSTLDFLFGKNMDGTTNKKISITTTLTETEGVSLNNGIDGSFATTNTNRDEAMKSMLVKAYSGQLDKRIKSRYSSPADFMLDANFHNDVKKQMVSLALARQWDAMTYLDCGLLDTTDEVITYLEANKDYFGNNVIKEAHYCKIRDVDYTGKTISVTMPYFLASKIPTHFKTRGLNIPMTLENFRVTGFVKGTFVPVIDPDEDEIKKLIYNLRCNCYETVKYGTVQRAWAITTQQATSDRLDEFNEYILQLAVKLATDEIRSKIYKFGEADDRKRYKESANTLLQYQLGPLVRSVSVDFTMSASDERKSIMRIVLRIVYKTVVKRGIVEIYLDPRA